MKTCNVCGETKPLAEFHKRKASKDGLTYGCKECKKKKARGWYANNKEHVSDRMKGYYQDNKEYAKDRARNHYHENREEIRARVRDYRKRNRKAIKERSRRYYKENRERILAHVKSYQAKNPERIRERVRQWAATNPERAKANAIRTAHRRRARKHRLPATLTSDEWMTIVDFYNNRCAYCCGESEELQQEHIVPVNQGGGYTKENIVPACPRCNQIKGGRTPEQAGMTLIKADELG